MKMKTKTKKLNRKTVCLLIYMLTIVAGTAGGYLLYRLVGCSTGSCSLTANPYLCIAFGGIFGAPFFARRKKRGLTKRPPCGKAEQLPRKAMKKGKPRAAAVCFLS